MALTNNKGKLKFLYKKINKKLIKYTEILNLPSSQKNFEYPVKAIDYLTNIAKKITKFNGGLLTFDYGYILKGKNNTLQSVMKHRYQDVLLHSHPSL